MVPQKKNRLCAPVNDDEKCIFNLCSFALKLQLTTTDRIIHDNRIQAGDHIFTILHAYTLRVLYITHYTYLFVDI